MVITSKQNPKIKVLVNLRRRREREHTGLILVDGYEELQCAEQNRVVIKELYYCPELMGEAAQKQHVTRLQAQGVATVELSRPVFEKVAYREGADGWLAIVPAPNTSLAAIKPRSAPLVVVCEAVEKPGNLGAILRTADAAGADAVVSTAGVTDWGNPNIVRASKGALFAVPVAEARPQELLDWLRSYGVAVVASTPDTPTLYTAADLTKGVALTVGSEKHGHSDFWLAQADIKVKIPMAGKVNSLNAATSAALLMYEAVRQRAA